MIGASPHRPRGVAAAAACLAVALGASACGHRPYRAPEAGEAPSLDGLPLGPADRGDVLRMSQAESTCRGSLTGRTIVASVQAVEDVTAALSSACDVLFEEQDPLSWRVWCRSDALFQSGHYLRASNEPFRCGDRTTPNAFACIGSILAERVLAPGYTDRVELVTVGHVDREPVVLTGSFPADGCLDLQASFRIRNRWATIDPASVETLFPTDEAKEQAREEWNDRLAWCRAAYAASELLAGVTDESARARAQVDLAVVGMGPDWLAGQPVCPSSGQPSRECADARRVDILIRFVPTTRDVVSRCDPPPGVEEDEATRALWCFEDCIGEQNLGQAGQGDVNAGQAPPLFDATGGVLGRRWILHRASGPTTTPLHVEAVRGILGMPAP